MTTNKEVKEIISSIADLRSETQSYVNDYISWVEENIPSGIEYYFGIGIARKHPRWGTIWGFENDGQYTVTGQGYYYANDFNYWVNGSTSKEVKEFAKRIPSLMKKGIEALESESNELSTLLKSKIDFDSLLA